LGCGLERSEGWAISPQRARERGVTKERKNRISSPLDGERGRERGVVNESNH